MCFIRPQAADKLQLIVYVHKGAGIHGEESISNGISFLKCLAVLKIGRETIKLQI